MNKLLIVFIILSFILIKDNLYAKKIVIGQSCALTGPTAALGIEMKKGAEAFFNKHQEEIKLITLDDGYEPDKAVANTKDLINKEKVDVLFGYVGTPTSNAVLPIANTAKKIFFGAFTGAESLRDVKKYPYSFNVRGSYDDETMNMVTRIVEDLGVKDIAIFYQEDAFGEAGLSGVKKALETKAIKKTGAKLVAKSTYKRNTVDIEIGAQEIKNSNPGAIILIGAYKPCAAAIKWWKKNDLDVPFLNISFVGSEALASELSGHEKNVVISQAIPSPWKSNRKIVKQYQQDIGSDYSFGSFEGYIAAKILYEGLKGIKFKFNTNALKDHFENNMKFISIDDLIISYTSKDHQALDQVYLTKINPGEGFTVIKSLKEL